MADSVEKKVEAAVKVLLDKYDAKFTNLNVIAVQCVSFRRHVAHRDALLSMKSNAISGIMRLPANAVGQAVEAFNDVRERCAERIVMASDCLPMWDKAKQLKDEQINSADIFVPPVIQGSGMELDYRTWIVQMNIVDQLLAKGIADLDAKLDQSLARALNETI